MSAAARLNSFDRRSLLVRLTAAAGITAVSPKLARADTTFFMFAQFRPLISAYLAVTGDVNVESQTGRKTKSLIEVELRNLNLPSKTKLHFFWTSSIFNTTTSLGSLKVDRNGQVTGAFTVKKLVVENRRDLRR